MADAGTFEIITGAGLAALILKEVFAFVRPLIPALNNKTNSNDKVSLALLSRDVSETKTTVTTMNETLIALDKNFSIHLAHHEKQAD